MTVCRVSYTTPADQYLETVENMRAEFVLSEIMLLRCRFEEPGHPGAHRLKPISSSSW